jgi:DNA-binding Lrp family transcriptional regulator
MPLSPVERSLLQVVSTRPQYCLENLNELGRLLQRSARTVQRAITTLTQKGILKKTYTMFKRIKLVLATLDEQDKIAKGGPIAQALRYCNFMKSKKKKSDAVYDTTPVSGIYTTPVSGSINTSNKIKSISNSGLNFEQKKAEELGKYKEFLKTLMK